ncbi:MAG: amino acid ABC transporter substrate-binding protein [Acidobacteriota bacterium]
MRTSTRSLFWGLLLLLAAGCSDGGPGEAEARAAVTAGSARTFTTSSTLDAVRARGFLRCGVSTGIVGFSAIDRQGEWRGLDVDVCRAIAAAVLGDSRKVRFTPLTSPQRFTVLQSREIDVLSRVTTITFERDVHLGIEFPAIDFYDGTGFMVRTSSNAKSVTDLNGATICIQPGTSTERDVADYFRKSGLTFTPVVIERLDQATGAYFGGRCDAMAQDRSTLAAARAIAPDPSDHVVLPQVISKSPFGPAVTADDVRWIKIVRWSVFAMIDAEELGLSSSTIDRAFTSDDPNVQRFVGTSGGYGQMLGLEADWAAKIVKQVGNFGESFDRNLRPLGIDRGANRLWKDGGLLYVPDLH